MPLTLPELPFSNDALTPHISPETLDYHYGKHHRAYVSKLNELVKGSAWETRTLEDIVKGAPPGSGASGGVFHNAAQVWNHTFYWSCLRPGGGVPSRHLSDALKKHFGGLQQFKDVFTAAATTHFGSGWAWLVKDSDGKLSVLSTSNADNPLREAKTPLLTCDVWEHAYYIDYRNARPKYIEAMWNLVNWDFVEENLSR